MNVEIIKSNRKTLAIEIKKDLRFIVHAPLYVSNREIQKLVEEKSAWIEKNIEKVKAHNEQEKQNFPPGFTAKEIHVLTEKALKIIPKRVEYLDMNFKKCKQKFNGFPAQIIQHQIDHCDGIVI